MGGGFHQGPVFGQGPGLLNLLDPLLNQLTAATLMVVVELLQLSRSGFLHGWQRGPALEEITGLQAVEGAGPVESLREIEFQVTAQLVGQGRPQIHQLAAMLDPQGQLPAQDVVGHPGSELLPVFDQQIQQQGRIVGIILGSTGGKGFPVTGQRLGVNRIEPQKVIVHQGRDHRAAALLQGNGDQALGETLPQLSDPGLQLLRTLSDNRRMRLGGIGGSPAHHMLLIGPVETDIGYHRVFHRNRGWGHENHLPAE